MNTHKEEIAALKAHRDRARRQRDELRAEIERLRAENAELRQAIRDADEMAPSHTNIMDAAR